MRVQTTQSCQPAAAIEQGGGRDDVGKFTRVHGHYRGGLFGVWEDLA